jgi:hypothetical protein
MNHLRLLTDAVEDRELVIDTALPVERVTAGELLGTAEVWSTREQAEGAIKRIGFTALILGAGALGKAARR